MADKSLSDSPKSVKLSPTMLRHLQAAAYCFDYPDAEHGGDCIDHNWMSVYRRGLFGVLSLNTLYALQKRGLVESVAQRFGHNTWETETFRITKAGRAALGNAPAPATAPSDDVSALSKTLDDYDYGFLLDINEVPIPAWLIQHLSAHASASFRKLVRLGYVEYGVLEGKYEVTDAGRTALKGAK